MTEQPGIEPLNAAELNTIRKSIDLGWPRYDLEDTQRLLATIDARDATIRGRDEWAAEFLKAGQKEVAAQAATIRDLTARLAENHELGIAITALNRMADRPAWLAPDFRKCARGALAAIAASATNRAALAAADGGPNYLCQHCGDSGVINANGDECFHCQPAAADGGAP